MTAYDASIKIVRDDSESTNFCVYFCNEKFSSAANLLFFSLNFRARNNVSQHYSLGMELNSTALVVFEIANLDKFLPVCKHVTERH